MDIKIAQIINQMLDKAEARKSSGVTGVDFSIMSLGRPGDEDIPS